MGYQYTEKRYNVIKLSSLEEFVNIRGGINGNRQDVYFIRAVGAGAAFAGEVTAMDREMTRRMDAGWVVYNRVGMFPTSIPMEETSVYTACYDTWDTGGKQNLYTKTFGEMSGLGAILSTACGQVLDIWRQYHPGVSGSMERNFVSKLLYWTDRMASVYLQPWDSGKPMKFVAQGIVKEQGYLFCYFLTLLGIDVLLLQTETDIDEKLDGLHLSAQFVLGEKRAVSLDTYRREAYSPAGSGQSVATLPGTAHSGNGIQSGAAGNNEASLPVSDGADRPVRVVIPPRPGRRTSASPQTGSAVSGSHAGGGTGALSVGGRERTFAGNNRTPVSAQSGRGGVGSSRNLAGTVQGMPARELTFEELARKASSVVMITLYDGGGEIVGTGSGIMIGRGGYILTNHHVACHGRRYSVRIENDETVYDTDEMIKYNQVLDLAVIRIHRELQPLSVYRGREPLVRGQKVVAIGSPLGLFNSVSDGIIAGFRNIEDVDMIQYTAPVTGGSSGGAVLNMYGEVIGIHHGSFGEGLNLGLAIGYEFINTFAGGFYT